jgi:phosphate transport system substrate-binding protein
VKVLRLTILTAAISFVCVSVALADANLLETGSSLIYPLMNLWVPAYTRNHPDVKITTQSTGSGTGISQAVAGVAQIGASDAYMSNAQLAQGKMLNIPLAISAQQINYNIPEIGSAHLNLSGPVLAGIYDGTIRYWDDPRIKSINAQLGSKLPHENIITIHRSDGSGDTFIFTQYLSDTTPSWRNGPGFGTTISWPSVPNAVGANGNPGMVQACQSTKYSIAYIGISFIDQTNKAGLGYAALQNKAGRFVLPTERNISAAAGMMIPQTPRDERVSLINAPGADSYPIINYEYAIVNPKQPNSETAKALKDFLTWAISPQGGQRKEYLDKVHFIALPPSVANLSRQQIAEISS